MKNFKFYFIPFLVAVFLISCDEDDDTLIIIDDVEIVTDDGEMMPPEPDPYENGFLVSHEGAFSGGFGTVSFLDAAATTTANDIYQSVNNDNLGGIVQSIAFSEDKAYVISNLSNKLTVVNRYTFEEIARVETGLSNPRYMAIAGTKGYITNWGDGLISSDDYIAVIDLESNVITGTISVPEGPEQIIYNGVSLYITHKGGFSVNDIVTVIDPMTNSVTTSIGVGAAPDNLEVDSNGDLWVLYGGTFSFQGAESGGGFVKINTQTNQVLETTIFETTDHPSYMDIDGDDIYYYLNGNVIKAGIDDDLSQAMTPILEGRSFYGMTITSDGRLLGCNAGDFNSNGTVEVYNLSDNTLTNTLEVGLIPAKVYENF